MMAAIINKLKKNIYGKSKKGSKGTKGTGGRKWDKTGNRSENQVQNQVEKCPT